jgi:membrane associated rhomboid family serine protease
VKIKLNSPVVLTFALLAVCVRIIGSLFPDINIHYFSSGAFRISSPLSYFQLFSYVLGHASWAHLVGNMMLFLLIGPILEEKYGSGKFLALLAVTALLTSAVHLLFFSSSLIGASGLVFMCILLASVTNIQDGEIPLTFIIVAVLYLGGEVLQGMQKDNIAQFAHVLGGLLGGAFGFFLVAPKKGGILPKGEGTN